MKIAFCLFKYYPFGGLERDLLRTVKLCITHGHDVSVLTMRWQGERPASCNIILFPVSALTNHARVKQFSQKVKQHLALEKYDVVIGFNRMPGLDWYFQADVCYRAQVDKKRGGWYQHLPRYKVYAELEKAVFSSHSPTKIFLLNPKEKANFIHYYQTQPSRFYQLPPGIGLDRQRPLDQKQIREAVRNDMQVEENQFVMLMVGSDFKRKGVDRSLNALACLPTQLKEKTVLWIIGNGNIKPMKKLATQLKLDKQVVFLGARTDVLKFYAAADVLLHPAYEENAGITLIEALVNGLPLLVSGTCGYAEVIKEAKAGEIIAEPFTQNEMNTKLSSILNHDKLIDYREKALGYCEKHDFFHLTEYLVEVIENEYQK